MKATLKDMKRASSAMLAPVNVLLLAMAHARLQRERVDKIERKVLSDQIYTGRKPTRAGDGEQFRVLEPKDTYQMDDQSSKAYFERLNAIHLADGFKDAAKGYCPALVAESLQLKAEWAVIEDAEEFFPGMTNDRLLCGTGKGDGLETRQKYLDLLIGLVVGAPDYASPL